MICNDLQIPILDMPRRPGICPVGTCFHVINRAVARLPLFEKAVDDAHDAFSCNLARRDGKVVLLDRGGVTAGAMHLRKGSANRQPQRSQFLTWLTEPNFNVGVSTDLTADSVQEARYE